MKVCLLGTDFNSANRGCQALGYSFVEIINRICVDQKENLEIYVFLYDDKKVPKTESDNIVYHMVKTQPKKMEFWRSSRDYFRQSDFVIDFTGGDSFSDIYGNKRFMMLSALKIWAIMANKRFVMGPQTVGPFSTCFSRRIARYILKKSSCCFVRDSISYRVVEELTKRKPLLTTDVAFSLSYENVKNVKTDQLLIGFNPSGLLWKENATFSANKHVRVDYRKYVMELMNYWCNDDRYEVHLIPHVFTEDMNSSENDLAVCNEIKNIFPNVIVESDFTTPMEAKTIISGMDIFIGARMHATIAAFSSGVATIPFSYSRKFEGLFGDLGYSYLIRGCEMNTEEALERTKEWVDRYRELQQTIKNKISDLEVRKRVFPEALKQMMIEREEK